MVKILLHNPILIHPPTHPSLIIHITTSIQLSFRPLPQERARRLGPTKPSKKRRRDRRGPRGWRAGSRIGSMTSTEAPGALQRATGGPRTQLLRSLARTPSTAPLAVARSAAAPSPPPYLNDTNLERASDLAPSFNLAYCFFLQIPNSVRCERRICDGRGASLSDFFATACSLPASFPLTWLAGWLAHSLALLYRNGWMDGWMDENVGWMTWSCG